MSKLFLIILLAIFIVSNTMNFSYASEDCEYQREWEECIEENINGNPWSIDPEIDFLCVSSRSNEKIIYNIILDKQFSIIDEKSREYIKALEENKDHFFGSNKKAPYLQGIDQIEKFFGTDGIFYNQYYGACNGKNPEGIMQKAVTCLGGITSISVSKGFFSNSLCIALANKKLTLQKKTAYNILELNKQKVRTDSKKEFIQEQRRYYNVVVDLFMVNLGYLLRISQKWASKTKNPY